MQDSILNLKSSEINYTYKLSKPEEKENSSRTKEESKFFDEDNNYMDYLIEIGIKQETLTEEFLYKLSSPNELNEKAKTTNNFKISRNK